MGKFYDWLAAEKASGTRRTWAYCWAIWVRIRELAYAVEGRLMGSDSLGHTGRRIQWY